MKKARIFIKGKTILIGGITAVILTLLIVYISGIQSHRLIIDNSLISLSILAIFFFFFLVTGLFRGLHLVDTLSHKLKFDWGKSKSSILSGNSYMPDAPISIETDDGFSGIILSIILWIAMSIAMILFFVLLEFVLAAGVFGLVALIYWLLMRGLKVIFSQSKECENDLSKSVLIGLKYTCFYLGWMYMVIFISSII